MAEQTMANCPVFIVTPTEHSRPFDKWGVSRAVAMAERAEMAAQQSDSGPGNVYLPLG